MSSRKLSPIAALGIVIALAGCGADLGAGAQNVGATPAVSPVAAGAGGYASTDPAATDPAAAATDTAATDGGYGASSSSAAEPAADSSGSSPYGGGSGDSASSGSLPGFVTTELSVKVVANFGETVVDSKGWTLYRFDKDKPKPPTSNCSGTCATTWPPVIVDGTPTLRGIAAGTFGMVKRADGRMQATLGGWPLYRYAKDGKAGQWKGQGVGGVWFAVTKDGKKVVRKEAAAGASHAGSFQVTELVATELPNIGQVVTDQNGRILYRFDKDTPKPPASNCSGACATTWPPAVMQGMPSLKGISADLVGHVKRADGSLQITIGGWPVYYYSKDTQPGEWKGQGVGGTWWAVMKDGKKNTNCPAMANAANVMSDRVATELVASQIDKLGEVVKDQNGWILYRFDKDNPNPPTSNCSGQCAMTWPPVLVKGSLSVKGIYGKAVGTIKRADGSMQVTLGGWPLYYYSKDLKPGDWKGQGVGGTWFAVKADGKKNTNCIAPDAGSAHAMANGAYVFTGQFSAQFYGSSVNGTFTATAQGKPMSGSGSGYGSSGGGYSGSGY